MGHILQSLSKMYTSLIFLALILVSVSAGNNPCEGITLDNCEVTNDMIVGSHPYHLDVCHLLCTLDDECLFWRHDLTKQETNEECLFLSTDYHQDCDTLAGPVDVDIGACLAVDKDSCFSVIGEKCDYTGERMEDFEFGPGETSSIQDCKEIAKTLEAYGVTHFVFLAATEECHLYASLSSECRAWGGPATAGDDGLGEC